MTCNSDLNSRDNCIYLTRSDRGYQTAHRNDKIVKISRLDQLLMSSSNYINSIFDTFKREMVNDLQ